MALTTDVLIIGGGPAGLSAALTLARQAHTVKILDSGVYRNQDADYMHMLPGFDHVDPVKFRGTAVENILSRYDSVSLHSVTIATVKKTEEGHFEATDSDGKIWTGRKLILATGVEDIYPDIEGYADCWGTGIFHCLFCKGYEERECASSGVLAIGGLSNVPFGLHVARQATSLSTSVTIYTNGAEELSISLQSAFGDAGRMKSDSRKIKSFKKGSKNAEVTIEFEDGSEVTEGFLAHAPPTKLKGPFAEQLGIAMQGNDIKAGPPFYQTSVQGVFTAGDNCLPMKNIPLAISVGSLAGMGASTQVIAERLGQKSMFG
ncbi:FAD/NAD(P)-binding domain-containing protein [Mytilinidion resinicola]|uniref:FAD/NAD(P)-binding domain-containing protein n=1 Tax=Mytilinidion resinicola TaxID=574789 RepID=A0A6A6Z5G2_9PEZI|nr:FAD/NAD(P)-binding domain-containing protein [Mytilinidion resinicola]KAF2815487.1 FAD/NAD(P)-binding domain-containing protein [Mytilinidion resinicola]